MSEDRKVGGGCGCWGLVSGIICVIVLWAILFGITIDGKQYGLSCSTERGVEVKMGEPVPPAPDPGTTPDEPK